LIRYLNEKEREAPSPSRRRIESGPVRSRPRPAFARPRHSQSGRTASATSLSLTIGAVDSIRLHAVTVLTSRRLAGRCSSAGLGPATWPAAIVPVLMSRA